MALSSDPAHERVRTKIDELLREQSSLLDSVNVYSSPTFVTLDDPNDRLATFTAVTPFPDDIRDACRRPRLHSTFGVLPDIGRFYSIVDNKLFLWPLPGSAAVSTQKLFGVDRCEEQDVITCVATFRVDPGAFPQCHQALVIGTATYLKIILLQCFPIDFSRFYIIGLDFVPFCLCAGPVNTFFVGTDHGHRRVRLTYPLYSL
jgi:hypothetical protein